MELLVSVGKSPELPGKPHQCPERLRDQSSAARTAALVLGYHLHLGPFCSETGTCHALHPLCPFGLDMHVVGSA